jgi:hypothetical protein
VVRRDAAADGSCAGLRGSARPSAIAAVPPGPAHHQSVIPDGTAIFYFSREGVPLCRARVECVRGLYPSPCGGESSTSAVRGIDAEVLSALGRDAAH